MRTAPPAALGRASPLCELHFGGREVVRLLQRESEVVQGFGVLRGARHESPEHVYRFGEIALLHQRHAEIQLRRLEVGPGRREGSEHLDGFVTSSFLRECQSEAVSRVRR